MKKKINSARLKILREAAESYDRCNLLEEIRSEPAVINLDLKLKSDILDGKRKRTLKNITIKLDPVHVQAIRKIATMKSIPYQTLIRFWLSKEIQNELSSLP